MIRVIISGCRGKMGRVLERLIALREDVCIIGGFDTVTKSELPYPVFSDPKQCELRPDCVIDFSHPSALTPLLEFCREANCAVVLATTGYTSAQIEEIHNASSSLRIFRSANMSIGVNVLMSLIQQAASILESWDIEIVEKHHRQKFDAPSGTALMLADAASNADSSYVFDRSSRREQRPKNEIGISSVRGGTIVGEHDVIFAGNDEVLTLTHTAYSREIFATGAIQAAKYLSKLDKAGLYDMQNLITERMS